MKLFSLAAAAILAATSVPAAAVSIGIGDFSGSETVESFEGIPGGAGQIVLPSLFDFGSGVSLTEPDPNSVVISFDESRGGATHATSSAGAINSGSDVPSGTGALVMNAFSLTMEFTFDAPVDRVGLIYAGDTVTLDVFDGATLLDTVFNGFNSVANWSTGFVGLEATGITRAAVTVTGFGAIDDLRFEAVPNVPLPASSLLLLAGLGGIFSLRRGKTAAS